MKKVCPKCRKEYTELENYCTKCGIELEQVAPDAPAPNRCSANKTIRCAHRIFADDDIYCCYCGSLTTYAAEKLNK